MQKLSGRTQAAQGLTSSIMPDMLAVPYLVTKCLNADEPSQLGGNALRVAAEDFVICRGFRRIS